VVRVGQEAAQHAGRARRDPRLRCGRRPPRRPRRLVPLVSSLELSDTKVYEPQIRARLGTTAHFCKVGALKCGGTSPNGLLLDRWRWARPCRSRPSTRTPQASTVAGGPTACPRASSAAASPTETASKRTPSFKVDSVASKWTAFKLTASLLSGQHRF